MHTIAISVTLKNKSEMSLTRKNSSAMLLSGMTSMQSTVTAFSLPDASYEGDTSANSTPPSTAATSRRASAISLPDIILPVTVTMIFEGQKTFSRDHLKAQLYIFEHKQLSPTSPPHIEIVSYIHKYLEVPVPRLFLSLDAIFSRFKSSRHVKGTRFAQESTVSYIFSRFLITNKSTDPHTVSFHAELECRDDDLATDSGLEQCTMEYDVAMALGPLPHIEHIRYPPGDCRESRHSAVEIEWQRKLKQFRNDHTEFSGAVRKASLLSTSTTDAIATFLKRPVDRWGTKIAVRRWQKAIHRVVLQNHVKKMTARLEAIDLKRQEISKLISREISIATCLSDCSSEDEEEEKPDERAPSLFIKLPSLIKVSRGRPSLSSLFSGNLLQNEDDAESGMFSPFSMNPSPHTPLDRSRKLSDPIAPHPMPANMVALDMRRRSLSAARGGGLTKQKSGVPSLTRGASNNKMGHDGLSHVPSRAKSLIIPPTSPTYRIEDGIASPRFTHSPTENPFESNPSSPRSPRISSEKSCMRIRLKLPPLMSISSTSKNDDTQRTQDPSIP